MGGVLEGFTTLIVVIAVGWLLGHFGVLDLGDQRMLANLSFLVGSPALLLTVLAEADVRSLLSQQLLATIAGVLVPAGLYVAGARLRWRRPLGHVVIGTLSSAYVNAGNLGLPLAAYVLGDAALVAPTLLLQLLVLQPLAFTVLDHDRAGSGRIRPWAVVRTALTNPMTLASLLGVALSLTGTTLPRPVRDPIELIGGLAVPAMLIGYGVALRLGPRFGGGAPAEVAYTAILKSVVQPLVAYLVARYALGLSGHALLAVTVTSALPTAQNIFTHATRYHRAEALARDTILVTTVTCAPVVLLIAALLG